MTSVSLGDDDRRRLAQLVASSPHQSRSAVMRAAIARMHREAFAETAAEELDAVRP